MRTYKLLFVLIGGMAAMGLPLYTGGEPAAALPLYWLAVLHLWLAWALLAVVAFHVPAQYQFGATPGTEDGSGRAAATSGSSRCCDRGRDGDGLPAPRPSTPIRRS